MARQGVTRPHFRDYILEMSSTSSFGYNSIKVCSQPLDQLVEPGLLHPSRAALPNQRGIRGEDDTLAHLAVPVVTNVPIVELEGEECIRGGTA